MGDERGEHNEFRGGRDVAGISYSNNSHVSRAEFIAIHERSGHKLDV